MEYSLTWKEWAMPARGPICALRASARPTSGSACSGWPTPKAREDGRTLEDYEKGRQKGYKTRKGKTSGGPASKQGGLAIAAQLAGWATPMVPSGGRTVAGERTETGREGKPQSPHLETQALLAGWATPTANLGRNETSGRKPDSLHHPGQTLHDQVWGLAGWQTPKGNEKVRSDEFLKGREPNGEEALAFGPGLISSRAGTEKLGALNPEHSRWLMGFPAAWGCCAGTGMPSCRK
jgi:hypothetical protein